MQWEKIKWVIIMEKSLVYETRSTGVEIKRTMNTPKPLYEVVKRIGDIFFSSVALIMLSPLFLVVSLLIVIEDHHSPVYSQVRIGQYNRPFRIYKFRTMRIDSHKHRKELLEQNEDGGCNFKMTNDPRVTKVGMFLRKYSIDELLQLFNILKSDMSIIGPRPFIPEEQAELPYDRLFVKPGLSCYWQIGGKNSLSKEEQIELDRKYIRERSLFIDIRIVFQTIIHVFSGDNN